MTYPTIEIIRQPYFPDKPEWAYRAKVLEGDYFGSSFYGATAEEARKKAEKYVSRSTTKTASPAATFAISIAVTAVTSFAVGFYVSSALAASQVLEALSR